MSATATTDRPTVLPMITGRDRAILGAVEAGRCAVAPGAGSALLVDGRCCSDQFAGWRLSTAGYIQVAAEPPGRPSRVALTGAGRAALQAA
jgi:hypothetical protein